MKSKGCYTHNYIICSYSTAWADNIYNDAVQRNLITELSTDVEYALSSAHHITFILSILFQLIIRNQNNEETQKVRVEIY